MKCILVTGGCGFIGTHLIHQLIHENRIICVDNLISGSLTNIESFVNHPHFMFIHHDICHSLENLIHEKIDEIYHLASIASPEKYKKYPMETLFTSTHGTKNVLDLCVKHGAKLVFSSTSEVYGDPLVHPQPEEYYGNVNTVGERSCYDEGKRVSETMLYVYREIYQLDVKIVRIFNTFGPYMDINDGRVITNFIKNVRLNKPVVIYGDGTQTRSFCYVDDTVRGLIRMMHSDETGPINIGNPDSEVSLVKLVELFEKTTNRSISIEYQDATGDDPKVRRPIITTAMEKLQWKPEISFEDGLRRTLTYFEELDTGHYVNH